MRKNNEFLRAFAALLIGVLLGACVSTAIAEAVPEVLLGCWVDNCGGTLMLLPGGQAAYVLDGVAYCGAYTVQDACLYLDDIHPPAWEHGVKWNYWADEYGLLLWNEHKTMMFTRGEYNGENQGN